MYSLKNKLNRSLALNLIVVLLLLLLGLNLTIQQLTRKQTLTRLQHDAESLISVLQQDTQGNWEINSLQISTVYNRVRSGHYYVVISPRQTIRSRSLFDFEFEYTGMKNGQTSSYKMDGPGEESWLVWQQSILKNGERIQIVIAEDMAQIEQSLYRFSLFAIAIAFVISLIFIFIQQKILARAFNVFDQLSEKLQSTRQQKNEQLLEEVPLEVIPLIREIDMLLDQLKQRIQRTRSAIGNLSHEIKKPLQILSLEIDSIEKNTSSQRAIGDIRAIVDRELRRVKISGSNVVGGAINLAQEIPYLIEVMNKIYPKIVIENNIRVEPATVNLDRDDLLELLGNLLDNACKFAHQQVVLQISLAQNQLIINIEDDGPGVEIDQLTRISKKGYRLDESVEGHGLGLSICNDIINSYNGDLTFQKSNIGGLQATAIIPLHG